jgi:uncharacterized protein (TIGR02147 family)
MDAPLYYRSLLQEELTRRCERNPRYSLRAFSRALGVDAAALSRILSDKLRPSPRMARVILDALALEPEEASRFLDSVAEAQKRAHLAQARRETAQRPRPEEDPRELDGTSFRVIADWYHYAILELTEVPGFRPSAHWIAAQLGISVAQAKLALERLCDLGLLEDAPEGLRRRQGLVTTADKRTTSPALRTRQRQILDKAIASLEEDPIDERSHTGMTMAIDPSRLELAKKKILAFNRSLCRFLEGGTRTRVYELSIALFPLQKRSHS